MNTQKKKNGEIFKITENMGNQWKQLKEQFKESKHNLKYK